MIHPCTRRQVLISSLSLLASTALPARAQIADRPIRIVVGYPAGGASDVLARLLAEEMATTLKQTIIVDNKPGAGGSIGGAEVAKSQKDGNTLFLGDSGSLVLGKAIYKNLPFDPDTDLVPVGFAAEHPFFLVVHKDLPARNLVEFLSLARRRPDVFSYASPGNGSPHHIAMEVLKSRGAIQVMHVPYKGAAPAITDLIGGRVPIMVLDPSATIKHTKAGTIRALAILASRRISELPEVPTNAEAGLPNVEASNIWALMAPRGTPDSAITALNGALRKATTARSVVQRLTDMGLTPRSSSPDELGRYLAAQNGSMRSFVRQLKLELN